MYLDKDSLTITLGSIRMTSHVLSKKGKRFILDPDAIMGWMDGPTVNIDSVARPNTWGSFSEPPLPGSRVITITGTAVADTPADLHDMRDQLIGVFGSDTYGKLSVKNSDETRTATVAVEGSTNWVQFLDTAASYKINLFAPDPRIYGPEKVLNIGDTSIDLGGLSYAITYPIDFGGPVTSELKYITNAGNSKMWPVFKVTGNFNTGFTVTDNRGNRVKYNEMVTMASPVTIDMGAGTATQNGVDKTIEVSIRDWFSVAPGATIRPGFVPTQAGSGWCDILYKDTWI